MTAFSDLVQKNLEAALAGMRGRAHDERVAKAGDSAVLPKPKQIDKPEGSDETPPTLTAAAQEMKEGIDLFERNHLNPLYQRYGAKPFHKAMSTVPAHVLRKHAEAHDGDVRHALLAAAAVEKAFTGANPTPGGPAEYADSTPDVKIPARPSHGQPGDPVNTYPDRNNAASRAAKPAAPNQAATNTYDDKNTAASRAADAPDGDVGAQWVYCDPSSPHGKLTGVSAPGVGDKSDGSGPAVGDLIHFNGPGGSSFTSRVTQLTTGAVIGEFAGQTVKFPTESISPHSPGGSDHATNLSTPDGLTDRRGPRPVGVGEQSPNNGLLTPHDGASNVGKSFDPLLDRLEKAHDPFYGGTTSEVGADGVHPQLRSPDDGAPLTPYSKEPPYQHDSTANDPGPGNKPQGSLTPREYSLIDRVVSHRGPRPVESAALKALRAGEANDSHRETLRKALRAYAFAAPGSATACRGAVEKLG